MSLTGDKYSATMMKALLCMQGAERYQPKYLKLNIGPISFFIASKSSTDVSLFLMFIYELPGPNKVPRNCQNVANGWDNRVAAK